MSGSVIITVTLNAAVDRLIEVDNLTLGAHANAREILRTPGGKGINISRVLVNFGMKSIATGFLGRDNIDEFKDFLCNKNVKNEFVIIPGKTRENFTFADAKTNLDTHIRLTGLNIGKEDINRLKAKLRKLSGHEATVIFSGSLPPGIVSRDFAALISICLSKGARVVVDTNGKAMAALKNKKLWLIKPNQIELSQLVGKKLSSAKQRLTAAKKLTGDIQNILFSCGHDGAYLITKDFILHGRCKLSASKVKNTVGCGDVLLAVFIEKINSGGSPKDALKAAVAAASASAANEKPTVFDMKLSQQLLRQTKVVSL